MAHVDSNDVLESLFLDKPFPCPKHHPWDIFSLADHFSYHGQETVAYPCQGDHQGLGQHLGLVAHGECQVYYDGRAWSTGLYSDKVFQK